MTAIPGNPAVIRLSGLHFRYGGTSPFELEIPGLAFEPGETVAVVGPSGSGKTTLLNLIAGTLLPDRGQIDIHGTDLCALDDGSRRQFRIRRIGQVLQAFELLHYLTVLENVMLPHFIFPSGEERRALRGRAQELLVEVGLGDRADARPDELSQGEQQRVAVCRALINRPAVLLADEPTGNLDQANKQHVVDLLTGQATSRDSTLIMATHDRSLLGSFSRVLDIRDVAGQDEP